ncbi:unnamed protein product [[Actinomadura] parvosata subsp. kistnae]|nr:unnamed protein product [Actinomadura parvosata subsp. kistnae]
MFPTKDPSSHRTVSSMGIDGSGTPSLRQVWVNPWRVNA